MSKKNTLSPKVHGVSGQTGPDLRLWFTLGLIALLAVAFWSLSRYPALNEKALMGGDTPMSGLAFETWFDVLPWHSKFLEIAIQAANWVKTNLKGMTFGVLFGAAALTLLSLGRRVTTSSNLLNSALGTLIGAPLGVCVNCAVPIAVGLHAGRANLAMTLSALIASPTLNIIVVSMAFALLPFEIAVIKLVSALVLTLIIIPGLVNTVLKSDAQRSVAPLKARSSKTGFWGERFARLGNLLVPAPQITVEKFGTLKAAIWVVTSYLRHLLYLTIMTVPLMLLAALLGAVMVSFLDLSGFHRILPAGGVRLIGAMFLLAIVASMAPVPIAFDVVLTTALLTAGLKASYAAVLLISLGSFSVYAMIVLWMVISKKTSLWLMVSVVFVAVAAGCVVHKVAPLRQLSSKIRNEQILTSAPAEMFQNLHDVEQGYPIEDLRPKMNAQKVSSKIIPVETKGTEVRLTRFLANPAGPNSVQSDKMFTRFRASEFGIESSKVIPPLLASLKGLYGGALALGDLHADGWVDVMMTAPVGETGLRVFANLEGKFVKQAVDFGPVNSSEVGAIALVDIVGDRNLDLIVTTIWSGSFLFENIGGSFSPSAMRKLPADTGAMSIAVGDLDRDNRLDIVLGNYTRNISRAGWSGEAPNGHNTVLWNEGNGAFTPQKLAGLAGQTLTSLIFDINQDGYPDYFHGDDVTPSDKWYLFGPGRSIQLAKASDVDFPFILHSTMSYDVGDWNNDLKPDFYGVQISHGHGKTDRKDWSTVSSQICHELYGETKPADHAMCVARFLELAGTSRKSPDNCDTIQSQDLRTMCALTSFAESFRAKWEKGNTSSLVDKCRTLFAFSAQLSADCGGLAMNKIAASEEFHAAEGRQVKGINALFSQDENGIFKDVAKSFDLQRPGWAWNTLFADVDQNGYQDLVIPTGTWNRLKVQRGDRVFLNDKNGFSDQTESVGLSDMTPTWTYGYFDLDLDDDLDMITGPGSVTSAIYRNDGPVGRGLFVSLSQDTENSQAIGARIHACAASQTSTASANCQVRWVKASGGYRSGQTITAHFGIGSTQITSFEVLWPDGEVSQISTPPLSGGHFNIARQEIGK